MQNRFRFIISLLIISIFIFIAYNIYELGSKSSDNQYNKLINSLNTDTTDFTSWISNKKETLNTAKDLVDNFSYEEITGWNVANPYLDINNDDPSISQIYIGLATGEFITGGQWVPPDDYDPRTRVWYRKAVELHETIISDVYIDRETGDKTVTISSPLYLDGRFTGVISADVFMNDISNWLTDKISGDNIYTYLLDPGGTVMVHTLRPDLVGTNVYSDEQLYESLFSNRNSFLKYFEEAGGNGGIVRMEYVAEGKKTRGIIRKIEGGDWYLSVAAIEEQFTLNFIKLNSRSILFSISMLCIILILLLLVIRIKIDLEQKNQLLLIDNEKDFLTGVFNRRYFNLFLDNLWKEADEGADISLLMIDIDYFKRYNDTYGHIKGDEALASVTEVINSAIRKQDVFARYGGEEFVLILEDVPPEDAEKIAWKIVEAVYEAEIEHRTSSYGRITLSIGVASMKHWGKSGIQQFINNADKALYKAKESGRNTVSVFNDNSA